MPKGWRGESARHALAAKGIRTGRKRPGKRSTGVGLDKKVTVTRKEIDDVIKLIRKAQKDEFRDPDYVNYIYPEEMVDDKLRKQWKEDYEAANEAGDFAIEELEAGNLAKALEWLDTARSIEFEWGDFCTWGPPYLLLDKVIRKKGYPKRVVIQ